MNESWRKDDAENLATYEALSRLHGISHRTLDWGSAESQANRFAVLRDVGLTDGTSVLDVGCGLGDLYQWLIQRGLAQVRYTGVDISPSLIELCRTRFPQQTFAVANILEEVCPHADFVFASGLFAKRKREPVAFMEAMIARMFSLCDRALAFNLLASSSDEDFGAPPALVFEYCRTITPWVTLRCDYHPNDFTIYMRRAPEYGYAPKEGA